MNEKIILSWSGGKDSALALYELMRQGNTDITLLTTITDKYERISMHGVRKVLLEKQAESLGWVIHELVSDNSKYEGLIISIISFGFKHGMLMDADMVFDVRFLPNPFYIEELKEHTGKEPVIRDYLSMFPETHVFLRKLDEMLEFLIPYFIKEGKNQLVIGIGCTGGMHRSVAIAEAVCDMLRKHGHHVILEHRDIKEKR